MIGLASCLIVLVLLTGCYGGPAVTASPDNLRHAQPADTGGGGGGSM
jgi:hypothetical protein